MVLNMIFTPILQKDQKITIPIYPPKQLGLLQTFSGNFTTEAIWGNKLAALAAPEDHVFLHDIADDYPLLTPRKYDHAAVGRTDSNNIPMEWNETWWCNVAALKRAYCQFNETQREKSR